MDDIDPKEEDGEEMSESVDIDEFILSEMDDMEDADEEGFGSGAFSSY